MPFDDHSFPQFHRTTGCQPAVAWWLFTICFMLLVMIALGGATRLTGSGLSIMEWNPIDGVLPPLRHAEWVRLFDLYRQIPQYRLLHDGMDLAGFQHIFWLEWVHRFWGRLLGAVFLVPLLYFIATRQIGRALALRLGLFFVLGGLQGAVGWFMVASGFSPDSIAVSPYRLVAHLALALALYAAILWTGLRLAAPTPQRAAAAALPRRVLAGAAVLLSLTILAGGFVAGTHAGLIDNTFPLMEGRLVPPNVLALHPWPRNFFETVTLVQFDHRLLATLTAISILAAVVLGLRRRLPRAARRAVLALGAVVLLQYGLGIATLLWAVPVALATLHQGVAVLLLTATLAALHLLRAPA